MHKSTHCSLGTFCFIRKRNRSPYWIDKGNLHYQKSDLFVVRFRYYWHVWYSEEIFTLIIISIQFWFPCNWWKCWWGMLQWIIKEFSNNSNRNWEKIISSGNTLLRSLSFSLFRYLIGCIYDILHLENCFQNQLIVCVTKFKKFSITEEELVKIRMTYWLHYWTANLHWGSI